MKLYYSTGACSLSPHIVLRESGLAFELILASTKTHKLPDGTDFYSINSLGYVPVLELDDGSRLREGPAIVQYIADQVPEKNLAPANGTFARYQLQEWLTFIGTELHKGFSPLFNPAVPAEAKKVFADRLVGRLNDGGRIVLVGSRVANGAPTRSQYAATKAALVGMARSWAAELAPRGITANVLAPGATDTPFLRDPARAQTPPRIPPIGRLVRPEEVAAMAAFLVGPFGGAITGQQIVMCGGASL